MTDGRLLQTRKIAAEGGGDDIVPDSKAERDKKKKKEKHRRLKNFFSDLLQLSGGSVQPDRHLVGCWRRDDEGRRRR